MHLSKTTSTPTKESKITLMVKEQGTYGLKESITQILAASVMIRLDYLMGFHFWSMSSIFFTCRPLVHLEVPPWYWSNSSN